MARRYSRLATTDQVDINGINLSVGQVEFGIRKHRLVYSAIWVVVSLIVVIVTDILNVMFLDTMQQTNRY